MSLPAIQPRQPEGHRPALATPGSGRPQNCTGSGSLYLEDFHGQLIEAPAAHWRHAPQPAEWKLVPVQGYHFGR